MKCQICKNGNVKPGFVTVSLEKEKTVVLIKNVPAEVCENCGEYYLDEQTTKNILEKAELAVSKNTEIEIIQYAA